MTTGETDMNSEIVIFLAYCSGVFLIFFFGRQLLWPLKICLRLAVNSLLGAGLIALLNLLSDIFSLGISVPLKFVSALVTGVLGVPGAVLLIFIAR